jgi:hypothetical protein
LGTVKVKLNSAVIQYPGCQLEEENQPKKIHAIGSQQEWPHTYVLGVGEFLTEEEAKNYAFSKPDCQENTPVGAKPMELGFGVEQSWHGAEQVKDLFRRAVESWSEILKNQERVVV